MQDRDKIRRTQNAILRLNCSDSLTLREWAERMKTKYGSPPGSPPFDDNFIDIVEEAFIALQSQGHARQIVRDRPVKWQVIKSSNLNNNRIFQIQQICNERGITTLCHFTRIENLKSILQRGLVGRSILEEIEIQFLWNDPHRYDRCPEANCLSISFPNYQMFYKLRQKKQKIEGVNDSQWIVLLLDAKVLWELECAFCQLNAADNAVTNIPLEDRKRPEALKGMFADFYNISHQDLQIPDPYLRHPKSAYPTHPQAEVLVFDSISVQFIKAIHFWHETTLEKCRSYAESYSQMFSVNQQYFKYRADYEVW